MAEGKDPNNDPNIQEAIASYMNKTRIAESGGNDKARAKTSSATGRYQFTNSTWKAMEKALGKKLNILNGAHQEIAMKKFTEMNANSLRKQGLPVNDQTLYTVHVLGASGGTKFLKKLEANPNELASKYISSGAVKANTGLLFKNGKPVTAAELYNTFSSKMGINSNSQPQQPTQDSQYQVEDESYNNQVIESTGVQKRAPIQKKQVAPKKVIDYSKFKFNGTDDKRKSLGLIDDVDFLPSDINLAFSEEQQEEEQLMNPDEMQEIAKYGGYQKDNNFAEGGDTDPKKKDIKKTPTVEELKISSDKAWLQDWYGNRKIPNEQIQEKYLDSKYDYNERARSIPKVTKKEIIDNNPNLTGQYNPDTGELSLTPKAKPYVFTHEANHYITDIDTPMNDIHKQLVDSGKKNKADIKDPEYQKNYNYLNDPDEVHARIQVLRKEAGIKPDQVVTPQDLNTFFKTYKGDNGNINDLYKTMKPDGLLNLLNYMAVNEGVDQDENISYAKNGGLQMSNNFQSGGSLLTEFNEGGSHEENPHGGIPQGIGANGKQNKVEEGEAKFQNYVLSDTLMINEDDIESGYLPKEIKPGMTFSEAGKLLNEYTKNNPSDPIVRKTIEKNLDTLTMLNEKARLAKEELDLNLGQNDQSQNLMFLGGVDGETVDMQDAVLEEDLDKGGGGEGASAGQYVAAAKGIYDLGSMAFGKSKVDTSGVRPAASVNIGSSVGKGALQGATAGAAVGSVIPGVGTVIGAGVGAVVGGVSGYVGGKKDQKKAATNNKNYAMNLNATNSDVLFNYGGDLKDMDDKKKKDKKQANAEMTLTEDISIPSKVNSRYLDIVGIQKGVNHPKMGSGAYFYSGKTPTDAGYNPESNREFVKNEAISKYLNSTQGRAYQEALKAQIASEEASGIPVSSYSYLNSNRVKPTNSFTEGGSLDDLILNRRKPNPEEIDFIENPEYSEYYNNNSPLFSLDRKGELDINSTRSSFSNSEYTGENYSPKDDKDKEKKFKPKGTNILQYANLLGSALNYYDDKKDTPEIESLGRLGNRYNVNYADENYLTNQVNQKYNNLSESLTNASGGSASRLSANLLAASADRGAALSDAYFKIDEINRGQDDKAQTFNLGIDQFNIGQSSQEKDINARNRAVDKNQKRESRNALFKSISGVGKEETYNNRLYNMTGGYNSSGEYDPERISLLDRIFGKKEEDEDKKYGGDLSDLYESTNKLTKKTKKEDDFNNYYR